VFSKERFSRISGCFDSYWNYSGNGWKVAEASWSIGRVAVLPALSPSEGERDLVMTTYIFLRGQAIDELLESHSVDAFIR